MAAGSLTAWVALIHDGGNAQQVRWENERNTRLPPTCTLVRACRSKAWHFCKPELRERI